MPVPRLPTPLPAAPGFAAPLALTVDGTEAPAEPLALKSLRRCLVLSLEAVNTEGMPEYDAPPAPALEVLGVGGAKVAAALEWYGIG